MLYVLTGEDDFSIFQALEEIKRNIGDRTNLAANTAVFDGQQVSIGQLRPVCEAVPFLADKRLVIIHGLLARFEAGTRPARSKKNGVSSRQDEYRSLAQYLNSVPDSTVIVLVDGRIKGRNPLLGEVSSKARVMSFPLLRDEKLRHWIQSRVREKSGSIVPRAIDLLARFVGSNLWIMAGEIDKLALFASGRRIEEEDVRRVVSYVQEGNVFAMVDAILESRAGTAEELLQQLLHEGAAPSYLLVMLVRQARMIVRVKELRKRRTPEAEIRDRLESPPEFAFRKMLEQANRYSLERLKEVYHKLLEADLSIKTGKCDPELVMNILVAELCQGQKQKTF